MHRLKRLLPLWLVLAGIWVRPCIVRGQSSALIEGAPVSLHTSIPAGVCGESMPASSVKAARRDSAFGSMAGTEAEASLPGTPSLSVLLEGS